MIALQDVSVSFENKIVLEHASLVLPEGRTTCLRGPSGCGKTTIMRLLMGLIQQESGIVERAAGKRVSAVFQEDRLLPFATVLQNLLVVGIPIHKAKQALDDMGLLQEINALPHQLSGGMQRRVALARAIAHAGELFFLDEPLQGLDEGTAGKVLSALKGAISGKTTLWITHDASEATFLGASIVTLGMPPLTGTLGAL